MTQRTQQAPFGALLWESFMSGIRSGTREFFAPVRATYYALKVVARTFLGRTPDMGDVYEPDTRNLLANAFHRGPIRVQYVRKGVVHFETVEKSIFPEGSCSVRDFRFCYKRVE